MSVLLVLDNPPAGIDFGIDVFSWTTGPNFKGLSLIPKGLHFVYHSTGLGARQGFFLRVGDRAEVIARHWDASTEEISAKSNLNELQLAALGEAIKRGDFNNNLGPYPFDQHRSWRNLTNLVTDDVLIGAGCDLGTVLLPGDAADVAPIMNLDAGKAANPYFPDSARVANWSDVKGIEASMRESVFSDISIEESKKGEQLSALHMDQSLIVQKLAETAHKGRLLPLLGELQLSFVLFLVLYSHPALQHWIACVNMICNSEQMLKKNLQFTQYFLRLLYEQLNFVPLDFFSDELSKENFLGPAMTALFSALSPSSHSSSRAAQERDFQSDEVVQEHKNRLMVFLNKKFGLFEGSTPTNKAMSLYQRKTRNNEDLDASEKEELLRSVDSGKGDFGSRMAAEDMPVIVSVEVGTEGARERGWKGENSTASDQAGSQPSQSVAEQDLQSSKAMMGSWGLELDRSLSSAAVSSSSPSQENAVDMDEEEEGATLTPGDSDLCSVSDVETKSGLTDREPADELPLTGVEVEMMKYSWRYPSIYAEIMAAQEKGVQEDFVMCAARVLEEHQEDESRKALLSEALLFLEEELSNQSK